MHCEGQRAVAVHFHSLENVGGLLIDQLLVRHVIESLLALLSLSGLLLLLFIMTLQQQILIQTPSGLGCGYSSLSSNG